MQVVSNSNKTATPIFQKKYKLLYWKYVLEPLLIYTKHIYLTKLNI